MKEESKEVDCEYYKDGYCWLNVPDSFLKCKLIDKKDSKLPCIKTV